MNGKGFDAERMRQQLLAAKVDRKASLPCKSCGRDIKSGDVVIAAHKYEGMASSPIVGGPKMVAMSDQVLVHHVCPSEVTPSTEKEDDA